MRFCRRCSRRPHHPQTQSGRGVGSERRWAAEGGGREGRSCHPTSHMPSHLPPPTSPLLLPKEKERGRRERGEWERASILTPSLPPSHLPSRPRPTRPTLVPTTSTTRSHLSSRLSLPHCFALLLPSRCTLSHSASLSASISPLTLLLPTSPFPPPPPPPPPLALLLHPPSHSTPLPISPLISSSRPTHAVVRQTNMLPQQPATVPSRGLTAPRNGYPVTTTKIDI